MPPNKFGSLCDCVPFWECYLSQATSQQQIGILWKPEVFIISETHLQEQNKTKHKIVNVNCIQGLGRGQGSHVKSEVG